MRYILISLFFVLLSESHIIAQGELPGLVSSGMYRQGTLGIANQPGHVQQTSGAKYNVGIYPIYTPELSPGEGREIIQVYCRFCHSTTYITMQPPLQATTWETVVYKMINIHGAPIQENNAKQIISYLQAHYTPETRQKDF